MKSGWKIVLFVLLITLAMVPIVSCKSTEAISVKQDGMIQLIYVKGQDLNLSDGVLVVDNGKKTTEIPLDSEEIAVSGYDKNKLGEQTVTFEYDGVTTQITVTVVERMVISDVVTDYLVGDSPNMTKGKIVVTEDDGTSKTVYFASNAVTISNFDSSRPQNGMDVKVLCKVGEKSYEGSFKANIHGVESVEFQRPNKITYTSHYTGAPDVAGGYFVLKGNGGTLSKTVNLTKDMVSGFDVSAATSEHPSVNQQLTVTYKDGSDTYTKTYDIKITYTDISMFNDNADAFAAIDWNGETMPKIESELGELAIKLMEAFVDMSKADRALIDESAAFAVARAAMVYGSNVWAENILLFEGAFGIEAGELVLYCESYEKVQGALELFDDKDSAIYTLSPLLLSLIEIYGDSVIYEDETTTLRFSSYPILNDSYLTFMSAMLEHVLDVYDALDTVPENWSVGDLKACSTAIEYIYVKIISEGYTQAFPRLYYLVSDWRTNDDLFDILYTYFYETNQKNVISSLSSFCLPSGVEELYVYLSNAMIEIDSIQKLQRGDTTDLFYNYYQAIKAAKEIKAAEGTLENYVYWNVSLNRLLGISSTQPIDFEDIFEQIRTSACGIYDLSAGLLGTKAYQQLLDKYIGIVIHVSEMEGYANTAEYEAEVKELFDMFIALSPSQQYSVLSTLNALYPLGIPEFAFDDSKEGVSAFSHIINNFMRSKLSEQEADTYNNLIIAIEVYANRFGYEGWENDFKSRMNKVAQALVTMGDEDKKSFTTYLGTAYAKYAAILAELEGNSVPNLGEWSDEFALLNSAILNAQTANYLIVNGYNVYNYFLASFERAAAIANNILLKAPENVIKAYYYEALFEMYPADAQTGANAVYWSYDQAITYYRNLYVDYLVFFGDTKINVYDTYFEKNMGTFLNSYYDMVSAFMNKKEGEPTFDKAKVLAVLNQFRLLDSEVQALFMAMDDAKIDLYHQALELFISENLSEGAATVAIQLYTLEQHYYSYQVLPNGVTLNSIKAVLAQIKGLYTNLAGEDKASFADFEETYSYYIAKCEALLASQGA